MTLRERLLALAASLPTNASVSPSRSDLEELVGDDPQPSAECSLAPPDLTVAGVAARFDCSPQTVRDWIKAGELRAYKFNGREYRITPAALDEFEEQRRNGGSTAMSLPTLHP